MTAAIELETFPADTDDLTCPVLTEPGNYHFEGRCEDCDVATLARLTLEQVDTRYRTGRTNQDQYEAYRYVASLLSPTGAWADWRPTPDNPTVRRLARKILRALHKPIPGELA